MSQRLTASVVVCAFTLDRWTELQQAVTSLRKQTVPVDRTIVVIDHNEELLALATAAFPDLVVLANPNEQGLSGARNTGVAEAETDVVAFLDDDAAAPPDWLASLLAHYADDRVVAVGGGARPVWPSTRPGWFPPEFHWVIGCSYVGLPEQPTPVRNLIGCNMSFRRVAFELVGGFTDGIGRVGSTPVGCEETELCIRLRRSMHGAVVLFDPRIEVLHRVTPERVQWSYFRRRCYAEGISKALVAGKVGAAAATESERAYVTRVLPAGFVRGCRDAIGRRSTPMRPVAIVAGLGFTTLGYGRGLLATRRAA